MLGLWARLSTSSRKAIIDLARSAVPTIPTVPPPAELAANWLRRYGREAGKHGDAVALAACGGAMIALDEPAELAAHHTGNTVHAGPGGRPVIAFPHEATELVIQALIQAGRRAVVIQETP